MTIRQLFLICGGVCLAAPQAFAGTRDDVIAAVQRCGVIHDNRVWLDCVYGAQQPMRAELGLSPAPEFQQRLVPQVQMGTAMPAPRAVSRPAPPRRKPGFFANLLSTHPPLSKRIARLRALAGEGGPDSAAVAAAGATPA